MHCNAMKKIKLENFSNNKSVLPKRDRSDLLGQWGIPAKREFQVIQENRGSKGMLATTDFRVKMDIRELPVKFPGQEVHKEKMVYRELPALLDLLVIRVKIQSMKS